MARTHLWNPWSARCWPFDATEESAFIVDLQRHASSMGGPSAVSAHHSEQSAPKSRAAVSVRTRVATAVLDATDDVHHRAWTRSDLTCVLTALRGGAGVTHMFEVAPGLDAGALLDSYSALEHRRATSEQAWYDLCANPTPDGLEEYGLEAGRLLPVPVARLWEVVYRAHTGLKAAVAREAARVTETHHVADRLQRRLGLYVGTRDPKRRDEAVMLGRQLFNPAGGSLFGYSHFLARRVGELSSVRVADLLGERRDDPDVG